MHLPEISILIPITDHVDDALVSSVKKQSYDGGLRVHFLDYTGGSVSTADDDFDVVNRDAAFCLHDVLDYYVHADDGSDYLCILPQNYICDANLIKYLVQDAVKNGADLTACGYYEFCGNSIKLCSNDRKNGVYTSHSALEEYLFRHKFPERQILRECIYASLLKKAFVQKLSKLNLPDGTAETDKILLEHADSVSYIANALYYKKVHAISQRETASNSTPKIIKVLRLLKRMYFPQKKSSTFDLAAAEQKYIENKACKKVYLFSAARHDNSGDEAILYCEIKFLKRLLPDCKLFIYDDNEYANEKNLIKKYICDDDIIVFHGGGNIGSVYKGIEFSRQNIIRDLKNHKIISFPQTIYFNGGFDSRLMLLRSVKYYAKNKQFIIFTREQKSYEFAVQNYKNQIYICPDIVLHENMSDGATDRIGALVCLRCDAEKSISNSDILRIKDICNKHFDKVNVTDLRANIDVDEDNLDSILDYEFKRKIEQFRQYQVVVTDRLHAMIFCAVSGTPCIVVSNNNHKIKESYKWIDNLDYISFCDQVSDIEHTMCEMELDVQYKYDPSGLDDYYSRLGEVIKN